MIENMTIEQANAELEQTVSKLENEALPMSESMELYARACELMAFCMDTLNGYKGRIETLNEALASHMTEGQSDEIQA